MEKYIETHAKELLSKFRRLNNLINHKPSIGVYHEVILKNILSQFLSKRCSLKTGFIYNSNKDKISKQIDILIVDENFPVPYYFMDNELAVVKPDAVILAIEVKSVLNQKSFKDAISNSIDFRLTGTKGIYFVFAYEAPQKIDYDTWYKKINKKYDSYEFYPLRISMLNRGIMQLYTPEIIEPMGHYYSNKMPKNIDVHTYVLSDFIATTIKIIEKKCNISSNPFRDYSPYPIEVEEYAFKFGIGKKAARMSGNI